MHSKVNMLQFLTLKCTIKSVSKGVKKVMQVDSL